jgi:cold shock CspA family protein
MTMPATPLTMGTIKKWKQNSTYCFAIADDPNALPIPGADIYVSIVDVPDGLDELRAGDRIAFTIDVTSAGLRAKNIKLA